MAEGVAANTEALYRVRDELRGEMDARFTSLDVVLRVTFAGIRRDIDDLRAGA